MSLVKYNVFRYGERNSGGPFGALQLGRMKGKAMKKQIFFLAAAIILFIGNNLPANVTIELPLDCAGTYPGTSWSVDFDLGVEFTDISHVYIDWSGEITAAKAVYSNNPNDPFPIDVGIHAHIGNPPNWKHTEYWGGVSTYPNPQAFDIKSEFIYGKMPWSEIYDGKGIITIYYTQPIIMDGYIVELGSVTLNNATLIIDGTLVPEPMTVLFLAMGTLGLRLRRRNK